MWFTLQEKKAIGLFLLTDVGVGTNICFCLSSPFNLPLLSP